MSKIKYSNYNIKGYYTNKYLEKNWVKKLLLFLIISISKIIVNIKVKSILKIVKIIIKLFKIKQF